MAAAAVRPRRSSSGGGGGYGQRFTVPGSRSPIARASAAAEFGGAARASSGAPTVRVASGRISPRTAAAGADSTSRSGPIVSLSPEEVKPYVVVTLLEYFLSIAKSQAQSLPKETKVLSLKSKALISGLKADLKETAPVAALKQSTDRALVELLNQPRTALTLLSQLLVEMDIKLPANMENGSFPNQKEFLNVFASFLIFLDKKPENFRVYGRFLPTLIPYLIPMLVNGDCIVERAAEKILINIIRSSIQNYQVGLVLILQIPQLINITSLTKKQVITILDEIFKAFTQNKEMVKMLVSVIPILREKLREHSHDTSLPSINILKLICKYFFQSEEVVQALVFLLTDLLKLIPKDASVPSNWDFLAFLEISTALPGNKEVARLLIPKISDLVAKLSYSDPDTRDGGHPAFSYKIDYDHHPNEYAIEIRMRSLESLLEIARAFNQDGDICNAFAQEIPNFKKMLTYEHHEIRSFSIYALGKIAQAFPSNVGIRKALSTIEPEVGKRLKDSDFGVREEAKRVLTILPKPASKLAVVFGRA